VQHRRLTEEELARRLARGGMPTPYADFLASLDKRIADASEARLTKEVLRMAGQEPGSFEQFVIEAQSAWRR